MSTGAGERDRCGLGWGGTETCSPQLLDPPRLSLVLQTFSVYPCPFFSFSPITPCSFLFLPISPHCSLSVSPYFTSSLTKHSQSLLSLPISPILYSFSITTVHAVSAVFAACSSLAPFTLPGPDLFEWKSGLAVLRL